MTENKGADSSPNQPNGLGTSCWLSWMGSDRQKAPREVHTARVLLQGQTERHSEKMRLQRKKWRPELLLWILLWIPLQPRSLHAVSAVNLRRFVGCAVREFTFLAKKPGCRGMHITTDACWGRCETWEVSTLGDTVQATVHRRGEEGGRGEEERRGGEEERRRGERKK
ncbi:unnamed protein product [Pleuronectes platessa]|uniref:Uncharacterized protein n=1 Tax=Pleuronectes platessa TaxID=8262 RepID=A0A9N7ZC83_PLEPL|nr:unnamed protein product [Pleuronectes platessa]